MFNRSMFNRTMFNRSVFNRKLMNLFVQLTVLTLVTSCASSSQLIQSPSVSLNGIRMSQFNYSGQIFVLSFDVSNPNPYPLPVKSIRYHLQLADERFASGESPSDFSVPASGDGAFDLSVELNLLKSAPQVASLLRGGMGEPVLYKLSGSLGIDIPFVEPVPFSTSGVIAIASN
jgi:LEA14-like dessication related protein